MYKPNTRPRGYKAANPRSTIISIETLTAEEQELESKLRELHAKKQALIETKALKFTGTSLVS
jgi:hypothetical protein